MKKVINKNTIFSFILGIILCSGIVYAVNYKANDISYTKEGWEVDNVNEALDSLYDKTENGLSNLDLDELVVNNGSNSFVATVGKKYLVFAITTIHNQDASATLNGATILSSKLIANSIGGTHGSGVIFICTATDTTITFTGGNTSVELVSLAYMQLD